MQYQPDRALAALCHKPRSGSIVVAQLGQTLDGRIATVAGASKYISGNEALTHLHRLRATVDAVLVGVGTVIADDPQLTTRLVAGQSPVRVVLDPSGRMPHDTGLLTDAKAPVLVVSRPDVPVPSGASRLDVAPNPDGSFAPAAIVAALAARGLSRVLVEGGADTVSRFLDADAVDLLHVLVAPVILGSGKAGLRMRPVERLDDALRPATEVHLFADGDVLFTCALRARLEAAE
jgi:diaminohydroxyphosphoribosylaminopyrimidine deaminase/5-amino-6-(5-phosphoribosylamino)uracil reductase